MQHNGRMTNNSLYSMLSSVTGVIPSTRVVGPSDSTEVNQELRITRDDIVPPQLYDAFFERAQQAVPGLTRQIYEATIAANQRQINELPENLRPLAALYVSGMFQQGYSGTVEPVRVNGVITELNFVPIEQASDSRSGRALPSETPLAYSDEEEVADGQVGIREQGGPNRGAIVHQASYSRSGGALPLGSGGALPLDSVRATLGQIGISSGSVQSSGGLTRAADIANGLVGMREQGGANRGHIVRLVMGGHEGRRFQWCGGFVNYVMGQTVPGLYDEMENPYMALNYRNFAREHEAFRENPRALPNVGDLVVFERGGRGNGHVGVVTDVDAGTGNVTYVSGNDNNMVRERSYNVDNPPSGRRNGLIGTVDTAALARARGVRVPVPEVTLALNGEESDRAARAARARVLAARAAPERSIISEATEVAANTAQTLQEATARLIPTGVSNAARQGIDAVRNFFA
jgi:uncharacterized protein (TIGR02594 family)